MAHLELRHAFLFIHYIVNEITIPDNILLDEKVV